MRLLTLLALFLLLSALPPRTSASFWDSIPGVSQIKSLVQVVSGDSEGAKKTQENFLNTAPVVSQVKSAVQAATGDTEGAAETQKKFAGNLEEAVQGVPVLGHIDGAIHYAVGDKAGGEAAMKSASRSVAVIGGAIVGGPGGAVAAGVAYDGLVTGIDSAIHGEYRPYGVVDYVTRIGSADAGEHFDNVLGLVLDGVGGKAANKAQKPNGSGKVPDRPDFGRGSLDSDGSGRMNIDSPDARGQPRRESSDSGRGSLDKGSDRMSIDSDSGAGVVERTFDAFAVETARAQLPENYVRRLSDIDFQQVNDVHLNDNCYYCSAAAYRGVTVSQLERMTGIKHVGEAPNVDHIVHVFREAGFKDTSSVFNGDVPAFKSFLERTLPAGNVADFAMAFKRQDGSGHVVNVRVWRDADGTLHHLITDFQHPVGSKGRFSIKLPDQLKHLWVILPRMVTKMAESDITSLTQQFETLNIGLKNAMGVKSCAKRVIGYVTSWSTHRFTVKQGLHLTHAIFAFFAVDASGNVKAPADTLSGQRLVDLFIVKKAHSLKGMPLKTLFAVGGWANSEHFSAIAASETLTATFIQSTLEAITRFQFDGVDIDWEYPVKGGAADGMEADKPNYVTFLRKLRQALDAKAAAENRNDKYLLTIAAAAGDTALRAGYDLEGLIVWVDWIHVMTYDFNGAWDSKWGAYVGPNAPLYHGGPLKYSGKLNANWALKQYVCATKEPSKIVMGLPFYGRYWSQAKSSPNPGFDLFRMAELVNGKYGGERSYRQLAQTWLIDPTFERRWENRSQTPYAVQSSTGLVVTYDDARSIEAKVRYAVEHNLGGVMVWSVDQDDGLGSLLSTVAAHACQTTPSSVNYQCNPLKEKRWWTWDENETNAGRCGRQAPLYKGYYPVCDPDDLGYNCCSKHGYCGTGTEFCDCPGCVDYTKDLQKLVEEPTKPSGPIRWHTEFDVAKPGEPRCGGQAPPVDGYVATCNPDDAAVKCCSRHGYCGSGPEYCDCVGCIDYARNRTKLNVRARAASEVRWHVGFTVVKPGQPRCGTFAARINGQVAICNPDDDSAHCCSKWGFCGAGRAFCSCDGCVDSRAGK
ncbi:putative Chitinase A1 [Hypsibius exemplaris]|uniref:Chitinase A1 n=1 Tax=Hypsibius exemplaris TaxID=2072580 RepID=A0A1W0X7B9_HYPEX|nr:putative Chitinase A1 [Hypsibius exemplaris]